MSIKHTAIAGGKWRVLSTLVKTPLTMIQLLILTRIIAPEDFGVIAIIMLFIGLIQNCTDLGFSKVIIYEELMNARKRNTASQIMIAVSVFFYLILWILSPVIANYYHISALKIMIRIYGIIIITNSISLMQFNFLMKELNFSAISKAEIFDSVMVFIVTIILAILGFGIWALIFGMLIGNIVKSIVIIFFMKEFPIIFENPDLNFIRRNIAFGLFQIGERGFMYLAYNIDKLIISIYLDAKQLGYYVVAYRFIIRPIQLVLPIVISIKNNISVLNKIYIKNYSYLMFFAVLFFVILAVTAKQITNIFLGTEWAETGRILSLFVIIGIYLIISVPFPSLLLAKNRPGLSFWWNVLFFVVMAITIRIGVKWGVTGVIISQSIAVIVFLIPVEVIIKKMVAAIPIRTSCFIVLNGIFCGVVTFSVLNIIINFISDYFNSDYLKIIIGLVLGIPIFILLNLVFKRSDVLEIKEIIKIAVK